MYSKIQQANPIFVRCLWAAAVAGPTTSSPSQYGCSSCASESSHSDTGILVYNISKDSPRTT
eukprot:Nitzschia sp. Nitz4//scaffold211_size37880//11800//11985//NITZ4_007702-RA/size37880-exonerate_est2genome-gene-0.47-mRNA-1//-1//CDS//3329541967//506//frame0